MSNSDIINKQKSHLNMVIDEMEECFTLTTK